MHKFGATKALFGYFWAKIRMQHDTFTCQILFISSLFVESVEMANPWKFQSSTVLTVTKLLRFENLTEISVPG